MAEKEKNNEQKIEREKMRIKNENECHVKPMDFPRGQADPYGASGYTPFDKLLWGSNRDARFARIRDGTMHLMPSNKVANKP